MKKIGANYANGTGYGGILSSFNGTFDSEQVIIETGFTSITCKIGDINDAYEILKEKIIKANTTDFNKICELIYETIHEYFGGINNINQRLNYYIPEDELGGDDNKVSNLKGTGAAMCVERSMLAQNLLKSLNITSYYKSSGIIRNGQKEIHSYNLIQNGDEYFIFDSSIPTLKNDTITPLITSIPKEVFDKITSPEIGVGYSVKISHYNPLRDVDVTITYDSRRKDIYDVDDENKLVK